MLPEHFGIGLFRRSKTLVSQGFFRNFEDWHSHIVPGVDDGMQSLEESLAFLSYYESLGVESVWCTPHVMEDCPNTVEHLKTAFSELADAYTGSIRLHLSSENMLDGLFVRRLEKGEVLPYGHSSDQLLVETSYVNPPSGMRDMLQQIRSCGFYPVLAHPERYMYMDEEDYERLASQGVRFQLNLTSLAGAYGRTARRKAQWLVSRGMVAYYGSDVHNFETFKGKIDRKY